jgi:hypothetical protein
VGATLWFYRRLWIWNTCTTGRLCLSTRWVLVRVVLAVGFVELYHAGADSSGSSMHCAYLQVGWYLLFWL